MLRGEFIGLIPQLSESKSMTEPELLNTGKENGEGMIIRYQTRKGTDIFGLGIPNVYSGTDWDSALTWCYLILNECTTLIDTGRHGNAEFLETLVDLTGITIDEIERIIITHSHEDHDGNLADIFSYFITTMGTSYI